MTTKTTKIGSLEWWEREADDARRRYEEAEEQVQYRLRQLRNAEEAILDLVEKQKRKA